LGAEGAETNVPPSDAGGQADRERKYHWKQQQKNKIKILLTKIKRKRGRRFIRRAETKT